LLFFLPVQKENSVLKKNIGNLLFIDIVGYFLGVAAQIVGTKYGGASLASLVNALNPVFITLFAAGYLEEHVGPVRIVSIFPGLAGVYIIIAGAHGVELKLGIVFSIASVILWSLSSVLIKKVSAEYDSLAVLSCSATCIGSFRRAASGRENDSSFLDWCCAYNFRFVPFNSRKP